LAATLRAIVAGAVNSVHGLWRRSSLYVEASTGPTELIVPENGLISINPPLTHRHIGSLSTAPRTREVAVGNIAHKEKEAVRSLVQPSIA
jgi:hypothetical protein